MLQPSCTQNCKLYDLSKNSFISPLGLEKKGEKNCDAQVMKWKS